MNDRIANLDSTKPNMSKSPAAAVIGWPVEHSLSPRLHQYWLQKYNVQGRYDKIPVSPPDLGGFLARLRDGGLKGINITSPYKEAALKYADEIEPVAASIGAINTLVVQPDGRLLGRNTDVFGFVENLHMSGFRLNNRPIFVLGAGGAARAALAGLIEMGARDIRLLNRSLGRAEALALEFGDFIKVYEWGNNGENLRDVALLVNTTTLGMKGKPALEFSLDNLPLDAVVCDLVYAPLVTDLLRDASLRGNGCIDGLGMLMHQARPAFEAFFGYDPEVTLELRNYMMTVL